MRPAAPAVLALVALLPAAPPAAAAVTEAAIQRAVTAGRKALHATLAGNLPRGGQHGVGGVTLSCLALVESGQPRTDPVVRTAIQVVRLNAVTETKTYHLALGIMLLDKLGTPADTALIQSMGVRLLAGQKAEGEWTYDCPADAIDDTERRRLVAILEQQSKGKRGPADAEEPTAAGAPAKLPVEVEQQLARLANRIAATGGGDNSNTQFALLGLWTARRHGLPVDAALARADKRFRETQSKAGGWPYTPGGGEAPAMSCAGLLGLAYAHAVAGDRKDAGNDPAIKNGLLYLGNLLNPQAGPLPPYRMNHYFLWSMERVAVAYGLDTIGDRDWYDWGAEALVVGQQPTGLWSRDYGPEADTSFALLFLGRANLAKDLSRKLRGKVNDPGKRTLRSGGVLPPPAVSATGAGADGLAEARRLSEALLGAAPSKQAAMLEQYRDGKGVAYTEALARALPRLTGETQKLARDALAERLARMTPATLRARLGDADAEMRRAAALACGLKEDKSLVPDLIARLSDDDAKVGRAARVALRHVTGEDFGPDIEATPAERGRAIDAWKAWWRKRAGK
jgi:hypothetical protein